MKVHHQRAENYQITKPVLTIGTFDGVHKGHQAILSRLIEKAKAINGESVVLTFHPHPRIILNPNDHGLELIQPIEKRIEHLAELGIDHLILYPFTKEFSRMSATEFVRDVLVNKIGVNILNIGYDHHFGRNREGSLSLLRELAPVYDFRVEETPEFNFDSQKISSTQIRRFIKEGKVAMATRFLGRAFSFEGRVVTGKGKGKLIGYPTANLELLSPYQIAPKEGVYAVNVSCNGKKMIGMMNIGVKPTVETEGITTLEVHILDFNENLYGKIIEVAFIQKIREEQKFDSIETLINQLKNDEEHCRRIFSGVTHLI